jgi:hypothetical protein
MWQAFPASEYYGGSAPGVVFDTRTVYPGGNDAPWFPGSDRRLCPLTVGGTTACVAFATLRPVLLGWWSRHSTPEEEPHTTEK